MLSDQVKEDLKNPWLRGILAVVAVTLVVNIGFITYAFIFPPNLVVDNYYEQGKRYFHDQQLRKALSPTAWRLQLLLPQEIRVNHEQTFRLYVMDHQGQPVRTGKVVLSAYRPNSATSDFEVALKLVDIGTFAAPVAFPLVGNWDLIARIDSGTDHFNTAQRIVVKP
ncbi:MAG: FixH family protein [Mariprofundus sp.]|nr:FixH family protein [Mariprofundus sp.]